MNRLEFLRPLLLAGMLSTLHAGISNADWVQTNGPKGGSINSFVAVPDMAGGTRLYAGGNRVWSTLDEGGSWTHHTNGLTDPSAFSLIAVPNVSGGHDIIAGTNAGVFRSTNDGTSWNGINNGITNLSVYALASGPNSSGGINLYAGTFNGNAFRSTNNGDNWTAIQTGLPTGYNVNELITTSAGTVLAATMNGIYRSTNFGANWTPAFSTFYAFSFAKNGSTLYAGTSNGVYRSINDGANWTPINSGLEFSWINSVAAVPNQSGVTLFAGFMRSTDNGATWTPANDGIPNTSFIHALVTVPNASGGTDLYAGTSQGVFRTTNDGDHWTNVSFVHSHISALEVTPSGAILAGLDGGSGDVFRSADGGASWTDINAQSGPVDFAVNLQGTSGISLFAVDPLTGVRKSTDDGVTWTDSNNDIVDIEVNSVAVMPNDTGGSNVIAGTYFGIVVSTNDGGSWQSVEPLAMPLDYVIVPNDFGGEDIFGGGFNGVWMSTNYGFTWSHMGLGVNVASMAATANGTNLFAAGDYEQIGVYRSTNHGASWSLVNNGLTDLSISALLSPDGIHLFAAGAGGVFLSADNGNSWSAVSTGLTCGVLSLALSDDGSTLLAGTTTYGVWKRPLSEMIGTTTGLNDGVVTQSGAIVLSGNLPNPFREGTTIRYALPHAMPVRLMVYDVTGRAVRTLLNGMQPAGEGGVAWDGRDESGTQVGDGVYLYRLAAGGTNLTRKMIVVR